MRATKAVKIIPGNFCGARMTLVRKRRFRCGLTELKIVKGTSKTDRKNVFMLARHYKLG